MTGHEAEGPFESFHSPEEAAHVEETARREPFFLTHIQRGLREEADVKPLFGPTFVGEDLLKVVRARGPEGGVEITLPDPMPKPPLDMPSPYVIRDGSSVEEVLTAVENAINNNQGEQ